MKLKKPNTFFYSIKIKKKNWFLILTAFALKNLLEFKHYGLFYFVKVPFACWMCFVAMSMYSCTSSGDPRHTGTLWWIVSGITSNISVVPQVAFPPAFSKRNAIGAASYKRRSLKEKVDLLNNRHKKLKILSFLTSINSNFLRKRTRRF